MKNFVKKTFLTLLFLSLFGLILSMPQISLLYAATGLKLWFDRMVPTLFPFMILSTLTIRQNLTENFANLLYPVAGKLYRISKNGVYCLMLGFLCGFPMGARTIGEMYEQRKISRNEASFLLAFCNNIGPVYYISFFLPVTGLTSLSHMPFLLFGMYGIPLVYGLCIRPFYQKDNTGKESLSLNFQTKETFQESLDHAMEASINGITTLGGYMILCNLLNLYPCALIRLFSWKENAFFMSLANCLFEITSGLSRMGESAPFFSLILLPIGGLSCLAQTKSMIKHTDLSMMQYLLHKGMQTLAACVYYFLLRFFLL